MAPMQPQPDPPRGLAELPSWLLSQAALAAHRIVGDALAGAGVRRHHFTVLLALAERGSTSQAELGRRLHIDPSDLHAVLHDLERGGLVARVRATEDRRRNLVELTPAGGRELDRLAVRVQAAQDTLLSPLSDPQRSELRRLLSLLHEHHRR